MLVEEAISRGRGINEQVWWFSKRLSGIIQTAGECLSMNRGQK